MGSTPLAHGEGGFGPQNLQAWLELNTSVPSCRLKVEEACRNSSESAIRGERWSGPAGGATGEEGTAGRGQCVLLGGPGEVERGESVVCCAEEETLSAQATPSGSPQTLNQHIPAVWAPLYKARGS